MAQRIISIIVKLTEEEIEDFMRHEKDEYSLPVPILPCCESRRAKIHEAIRKVAEKHGITGSL